MKLDAGIFSRLFLFLHRVFLTGGVIQWLLKVPRWINHHTSHCLSRCMYRRRFFYLLVPWTCCASLPVSFYTRNNYPLYDFSLLANDGLSTGCEYGDNGEIMTDKRREHFFSLEDLPRRSYAVTEKCFVYCKR